MRIQCVESKSHEFTSGSSAVQNVYMLVNRVPSLLGTWGAQAEQHLLGAPRLLLLHLPAVLWGQGGTLQECRSAELCHLLLGVLTKLLSLIPAKTPTLLLLSQLVLLNAKQVGITVLTQGTQGECAICCGGHPWRQIGCSTAEEGLVL
jgi:hypothetical protein